MVQLVSRILCARTRRAADPTQDLATEPADRGAGWLLAAAAAAAVQGSPAAGLLARPLDRPPGTGADALHGPVGRPGGRRGWRDGARALPLLRGKGGRVSRAG